MTSYPKPDGALTACGHAIHPRGKAEQLGL